MKFRKKPVVIEAIRFVDGPLHEIEGDEPVWYQSARTVDGDSPGSINYAMGHLLIRTLEGQMRADPGDWIIRGVKGEIYPCKPDIFEETYEPVSIESLRERAANVVANDREWDQTKSMG